MRALFALLLCGLAASAFGHGGGGYHAPTGEVPRDNRDPSDPPPPPDVTPAPPVSWTDWWRIERDAAIAPRDGLDRGPARRAALDAAPRMRALLFDETRNGRVRCAALLALARIGDDAVVPFAMRMIRAQRDSVPDELRACAALALGSARRDDAATRAFLIDVVSDSSWDYALVGPFAAVSLARLGDDRSHDAAAALVCAVARSPGSRMRPASFLALGTLGDASAVPDLESAVRDHRVLREDAVFLSDDERAYAVEALVRVGDPAGAWFDVVARLLRGGASANDAETRRAAVAAFGRFAARCPIERRCELRSLLVGLVDAGSEDERRMALVSLGRLGAVETDPKALAEIAATLRRPLRVEDDRAAPFAAWALGFAAAGRPVARPHDFERLRRLLREFPDRSVRGAFALALALARDDGGVETIDVALADVALDSDARASCALALGLLGARDRLGDVRAARRCASNEAFVVDHASARALLGDADVVDEFVAVLRDPDASEFDVRTACLVLARVGDERAVGPLLDLAEGGNRLDLADFAVDAVGRIGARDTTAITTDAALNVHDDAVTRLAAFPWTQR